VMGDNDISVAYISQGSSERNWTCGCCWQGLKSNDWIGKRTKMISILRMSIRLRL
jgi:hypothetical protein